MHDQDVGLLRPRRIPRLPGRAVGDQAMKAAVEALRDATADIDLRADLFGQG